MKNKSLLAKTWLRGLVWGFLFLAFSFPLKAYEIWVAPHGNDTWTGTRDKPLRSLYMAQRKARELRRLNEPGIENGIFIKLKEGTYYLDEPLRFRSEDAGTLQSPTVFQSGGQYLPVISGGVRIEGWRPLDTEVSGLPEQSRSQVWEADIPRVGGHHLLFRQLWIDRQKATRASSLNEGEMDRILSVDAENELLWIPRPDFLPTEAPQLEFTILQWWAIANLRVRDYISSGDSIGLQFHQPESRIQFQHPWPAPFIDSEQNLNGNSAFFFANAPELLDAPGEWYADMDKGKVYYWPREGEDMLRTQVIAPVLENLVQVGGTLDAPVAHLHFEHLSFQHTSWLRPSLQGHVPLQAGMYILEAYPLHIKGTPEKADLCNLAWTGRQPAAFSMEAASHIRIEACEFSHLAATGIDLLAGTSHNIIEGNLLTDIGGTGIQLGFFGSPAFEDHLPYDPLDARDVCRFETIRNNLIVDATNEDWGCVGIGVGYAHDITISNNDVSGVNYSAISLGWGWTSRVNVMKNNLVHANRIHDFARMLYDVGGVYTLSAQPNTEISENVIYHLRKAPYAHIPDHYQYIYFDEGSSYIRAVNNWTEADKFFSNTPGPGNEWHNNGPQVSDEIRDAGGIQPGYDYLREWLRKINR